MAWEEEAERRMAKNVMDTDLMEMLQSLKTRNGLALEELTSLYEAWRGRNVDKSIQHAQPKVKASSKNPEFTVPQPFQMMVREAGKREKMKDETWADVFDEQSMDDAECLKQFRAHPVPAHVFLPMYNEIMEQNEQRRNTEIQKRKAQLLSIQKPFQLLAQDRNRPVSAPTERVPSKKKPIPKSVLDPTVSEGLREAEMLRKISSHLRAKDLLESSSAPVPLSRDIRDPDSRTSLRTKQQHLGFLQQNLTFQPHINPSIPDFQTLYRKFQKLSLKKQSTREPTVTKPFNLRTSSLRSKSRSRTDVIQETLQETPMQRPLAHLASLSPNTLPVYITDSTKRREVSIRSSLQERYNRDIEMEKWLREHRQKSQRMQRSVSSRAKALDPHKPLAACNKEKLEEMRQSDRKRTQEYRKELEDMRKSVSSRAYLFESVSKGRAIKEMEKRSTKTLVKVGLNDNFVEQNGSAHPDLNESPDSKHDVAESE